MREGSSQKVTRNKRIFYYVNVYSIPIPLVPI